MRGTINSNVYIVEDIQQEENNAVIPRRYDGLLKQKNAVLMSIYSRPCSREVHDDKELFRVITVKSGSQLHGLVENVFKNDSKFNNSFVVTHISRVYNPRLLRFYEIKREENFGNEELLFHGTPFENLHGILLNNFDKMKVKRGRYGWGVNFNMYPFHSTRYSKSSGIKVMILARVLVGKYHVGNENMNSPYPGFDSTTNPNGQILVKYENNSFYPEFVIHYEKKREEEMRCR